MPGLFVTATGTDVGKTYVACGLIGALRRAGQVVTVLKPVASGFDPADPAGSDTAALIAALGLPLTPERVAAASPWRFKAPLSPDMAARLEAAVLPFDAVVDACRAALPPECWRVVEGVGGIMVPLGGGRTVLDLMARVALPVVLVSPTGLGALSHLLTAVTALRTRDIVPAMIVLSETDGSRVPLDLMVETLGEHGMRDDLVVLRRAALEEQDVVLDAILAKLIERMATRRAD